jgi:hypothetical protein
MSPREYIKHNIELFMRVLHQEYIRKRTDLDINGPIEIRSRAWGFLGQDPMHIPELMQIAQTALEKYHRSTVKQINPPIHTGTMTSRAYRISPGSFSQLPLEIALEITSYLSGPDLRRMIIASQWKLPDTYWKRGIPPLLFEFWETLTATGVDWQYVALEFSRLMERTEVVYHRLRLAEYLARIHASCHNSLEEVSAEVSFITYINY